MSRIRVVDMEGNGTDPPAEIIEYGYCDLLHTEGGGWDIALPLAAYTYGVTEPLDPCARAIHHFTPADLEGQPLFDPEAVTANAHAAGAILLAAHAWDLYEAKWLAPHMGPLKALCTYKAALRVWPDAPAHGNSALRYWLEDQGIIAPDHELTQPAHRAGPDAYTTANILKALLEHESARTMEAWTREPAMLPRCPIGEDQGFRDKKWSEVDGGFLRWMLGKPSMDADLKWNARRELERREIDQRL